MLLRHEGTTHLRLQSAWEAERARRKELHQRVLELKGAIRVFCRVRPLTAIDGAAETSIAVKDSESLVITVPNLDDKRRAASAPISNGQASPPQMMGKQVGCAAAAACGACIGCSTASRMHSSCMHAVRLQVSWHCLRQHLLCRNFIRHATPTPTASCVPTVRRA